MNDTRASIDGLATVLQLMLDSLIYFCKKYDLNMNQANIILTLYLYREMSLKELSDRLGMPKSTASRIVEDLVEAGKICRTVPEENRRTVRLSLTESYEENLRRLNQDEEFQRTLTKELSQEKGYAAIGKLRAIHQIIHSEKSPSSL